MGNKWKRHLAAAILCCSMNPLLAGAQSPPESPPQAGLKLVPLPRSQGEQVQAWIETASLVRVGNQAGAWVLRVNQFDVDGLSGKNRALWFRILADCQQRTTMDLVVASISPAGEVRKAMQFPPRPPVAAKPGTIDAKIIDGLCNPTTSSAPSTDQVSAAITATRDGTAIGGSMPRSPTAAPAPLSPPMKRECAINYDTLANIAVARKLSVILGELAESDAPALEAAAAAYRSRSRQADPTLSTTVLMSESIKRQSAYDQAEGEARGPAKMAALNRIKAMAGQCDRMLGVSAVTLP